MDKFKVKQWWKVGILCFLLFIEFLMKVNIPFICGIAFVVSITGITIADVGETSKQITYTWHLPIGIFWALATPFLLGYFGGRWGK